MLHIMLLILKIIGILLAVLIGVVLLAVCCVLFVPVRYRIEVSREEGDGTPPFVVRAKITWLLHLVNIHLRYPADVYVRVRLLLFTLFRIPEAEKERKEEAAAKKTNRKKRQRKKTAKKDDRQAVDETNAEAGNGPEAVLPAQKDGQQAAEKRAGQTGSPTQTNPRHNGQTESLAQADSGHAGQTALPVHADQEGLSSGSGADTDAEAADGTGTDSADAPGTEAADVAREPSGLFGRIRYKIRSLVDRIRQFLEKLKAAIQNIRYTIRHMCDKIKTVSDTIQYYREVLASDAFIRSWELCREQAWMLFREIKPDTVEAELIVGTGDPASTGEILAVCGILYPVLGPGVRIAGDFERAHLEGFVFIKGKIRAFKFLRTAWKLYRNKDIRTLIKLFKKEAV